MGLSTAERNRGSHDTEALYRDHGAAVARLCGSLLRDRAEAEDATQQVFLSAHRALLNGSEPREPLAWLLTVARNECYARFRQRAIAPVPAGEAPNRAAPDASAHVLRAGEIASVWDEVSRLPHAQREAFLLREIRGLSYGQLADELSLSPPSVRSLLLRARTRLRQRLGDVAAGLGSAPWVQALVRFAGGDGASPVPAATKAAAVGIGALALAGGGSLVAHHASRRPAHAAVHRRAATHARRAAAPAAVVVSPREDRPGFDLRRSERHRSRGRGGGSSESGSRRSGSRDVNRSGGGGRDGSDDAAVVVQPVVESGGGGGSSSSGSGRDGSVSGSSDSGSSESSSGSDEGSGPLTSTVSSGSDGSDGSGSGGSDDGGGSGHGGSDGGHGG